MFSSGAVGEGSRSCTIDGSHDGVTFDDVPDEEDADGEFS